MPVQRKSYFIAGTDTDVGKTVITCALLTAAVNAGYSAVGMKPLAAGSELTAQGLRNADALKIQQAGSLALSYDEINPVCLQEAASPHIAAELAQRKVRVERLAGFCQGVLSKRADLTLIEGVGGWRAPVNERETMAYLAKQLKLPVIVVVGMRLGCLNHALLTAEAIVRDGLQIAGWVANRLDPALQHYEKNRDYLQRELEFFPLLAEVPYLPSPVQPGHAAQYFVLDQLLQQ